MVLLTIASLRTHIFQDIIWQHRTCAGVKTSGLASCLYSRCMSQFSVTRSMLGISEAEIARDEAIIEPPPTRIYHCKRDVRCMPRKMNVVAKQIRKLPVDEAITQMQFSPKKAAETIKQVLEEAKKIAIADHGVEDGSNLFVERSYVGRSHHIKQIKYHARGKFGIMQIHFCHYFLVLQEGPALGRNKKKKNKHLSELQRFKKFTPRILNSLASY